MLFFCHHNRSMGGRWEACVVSRPEGISAAETIFDAEREIAFGQHRSVLLVREDAG